MKGSIVLGILMILLATLSCYANRYTLADANIIIVILIFIVIALIVMGCYSIRYNRIISQRNEQLLRILTALDNYRAIVGDEVLTLDEQEEILKKKLPKPKKKKVIQKDDEHNYFVMMDARINKEKPFTDPDFDQDALIQYAAKILMESSDYSMDDLAVKCGFRNIAAFNSAFKFSFGITPTEFLRSMSLMFKKKGNDTRR